MDSTGQAVLEIGAIIFLAAMAGWLARRLAFPAVLGYLLTGLVVSPFTPGYVADRGQISVLADIGVVLLLFEVGLEIDPLRLGRESRKLMILAPLQLVITTGITGAAVWLIGLPAAGAAVIGISIAMSSSVVVVNITRSRRRTTDEPTEQALLGWSVIQDLTGVALATVILLAFGLTAGSAVETVTGLVAFAIVTAGFAWILPALLRRLRTQTDLFLLISVAAGLVVAGIGARLGLPLALAAFVAGLAISESRESEEARRRLLPFREVFAVLFFVAIGMLIDPRVLPGALGYVALLIGLLVVAKVGLIFLMAKVARLPARRLQLAVGLGQIGEFSFVLTSVGLAAGVIPAAIQAAVLVTLVVSIGGSAVLARVSSTPAAKQASIG